MLVESNFKGAHGCTFNESEIKEIRGTDPRPHNGVLVLMPGINQVDDREWDIASRNPTTQLNVQAGRIVASPVSLRDLDADSAATLIANCVVPSNLRGWLQGETREPVRAAIEAQLKSITPEAQRKLAAK